MSTINGIQNLQNIAKINNENLSPEIKSENSQSFGNMISDFLKAVNENKIEATESVADILTGKSENLHQTMAKVEESKLSFELMLEIRNKLLESFKEIQRMPV